MTSADAPADSLFTPTFLELSAAVKQAAARVLASGGQGPRDEEAVHDFRVALRRLRTLLRPARRVYGDKRTRAVADDLRRFADATSVLRDEEVLRETLGDLTLEEDLKAELAAWMERRAQQERAQRARVVALLRGATAAIDGHPSLEASLDRLARLVRPKNTRHRSVGKVAQRALGEAARAVSRRASSDPANAAAMHELRIRWKRLRYTAELFAQIAGPDVESVAKVSAKMQKHLGHLHDLDEALVRIGRARGLQHGTRDAVKHALRAARDEACVRIQKELAEAIALLSREDSATVAGQTKAPWP